MLTQVTLKHWPSGNKNPPECWVDACSLNIGICDIYALLNRLNT